MPFSWLKMGPGGSEDVFTLLAERNVTVCLHDKAGGAYFGEPRC